MGGNTVRAVEGEGGKAVTHTSRDLHSEHREEDGAYAEVAHGPDAYRRRGGERFRSDDSIGAP